MKQFWQEHRSRLRGYIAKRVRERDAVDDILREVFIKVNGAQNERSCPASGISIQ